MLRAPNITVSVARPRKSTMRRRMPARRRPFIPATRFDGDTLQWRTGGAEIIPMTWSGTVPGVTVDNVAARCGPGTATLAYDPDTDTLRFAAPYGSFGDAVNVSAGGSFTLRDADRDRWIRVTVTTAYLSTNPEAAHVVLAWTYTTGVADADVATADATAGLTTTTTCSLKNNNAHVALSATVWLEFALPGPALSLSFDNVSFYSPTDRDAAVATIGTVTIAAGASQNVYVKRVVAAGSAASPRYRVRVIACCDAISGGYAYSETHGMYRVQNAAEYRLYRKAGSIPVVGVDAPYAVASSTPATPAPTFADGDWWVAMTRFNGYLECDVDDQHRFQVTGGVGAGVKPSKPKVQKLTQRAAGVVRVVAEYWPFADTQSNVATTWKLWATYTGVDPNTAAAPTDTVTMTFRHGFDRLVYDLPAQAAGTTIKVVVRCTNAAADGPDGDVMTLVNSLVTAGAPVSMGRYRGVPEA